ncbi:MAG: phosphoribosylaminoimidazolesuccinocarboxamide synthase [Deltaproteobacteria bacterium]|nr:phosphoribosylaminoimidazolesuccinocarboxamide synthase [Deltaproteobacteria bacterium]
MTQTRQDQIREGKSKILFSTKDPNQIIQYFKDDATAFNALKKGTIKNKGLINNRISSSLFQYLERKGIQTHFIKQLSEREMLVKKLEIIPVEVVIRNRAAGSLCKRLAIEKGMSFDPALVEYFYKSDALGDPLISEGHILHFRWATAKELSLMVETSLKVNEVLRPVFKEIGLELIDFKLEFGRDAEGKVFLADEFTADGCRLWDLQTQEPMDKDRFRQDLGGVDEAYLEVSKRLQNYFEARL